MPGISSDVRRLRKAIGRDQFRLVYQPKADMRSGSISGVEALARWESPRRGLVNPSEFVPRAERNSATIQALTEWTLETAFRQAAEWEHAGHNLSVAVNLSPKSATDPELPGKVRSLLNRFDCVPSSIQLELTETAVFGSEDPERVGE